ncbi:MAG TPA: hypothetical protein VFB34_08940, partial [Chloroflexota bacterium]|nr:hypothetical protein [Chloroflexota bacterium]
TRQGAVGLDATAAGIAVAPIDTPNRAAVVRQAERTALTSHSLSSVVMLLGTPVKILLFGHILRIFFTRHLNRVDASRRNA